MAEQCAPDKPLSSGASNKPFTMSNSTAATDNENNKNFKRDQPQCSPSRVLHVRQIPSGVTEAEVISLGLPFGKVTNILMLKGRRQAFLEMASEEAAITMINYYTAVVPYLRHQAVHIQYSIYRELKTDNLPNQARAQAALQTVNAMESRNLALSADGEVLPGQGSVLRIVVENIFFPVTLEVLYQVFSKFGYILKIVTFIKNNKFHSLLQYADPMNAFYAKVCLDGHSIYTACCTLRVDFSRLHTLHVKYNNHRCRDFTRFDLPFGNCQLSLEPLIPVAYGAQNAVFPPYAGAVGFVPAIGIAQGAGHSVSGYPGELGSLAVITPAESGHMTASDVAGVPGNSVLLVCNLNLEVITPDGLFILFGVYGDVHRVKIMFKKKGNALVQMADATQAQLAINYLDGQKLYGRVIHTTLSKYQAVKLPYEGQEDQGLTKDYSNSPLHRFRNPGSKDFQNIFPPSATLHLSNIPMLSTMCGVTTKHKFLQTVFVWQLCRCSVSIDDLKKLFANVGSTVKALRFLPDDGKMALVQLGCVEEALHALIELHNYDLGENHRLRISFSRSTI